jgi:flavin reductase (DIM6/NTAB) family NADH-FMN oxidoreductase RutF
MLTIDPKETKTAALHSYLLHAIAPRPIAFASTVDKDGNPNLSPFSFFNFFSTKPPIAIISPARRGRDNTVKHTYENVKEVPEVVINVVNYDLVQQASLSSTEYPKGVNEFIKSGLTPIVSDLIKPFRVKESPVQLECRVKEVIELGQEGGAGNLVLCEILRIHISEAVLDENKNIDQNKIDLVGRMGGDWYCRASGSSLFKVAKPLTTMGIGVDAIPGSIRNSNVLTGNNLGQLGNTEHLPSAEEVREYTRSGPISKALQDHGNNRQKLEEQLHHIAKQLLSEDKVQEAWKVLLAAEHHEALKHS